MDWQNAVERHFQALGYKVDWIWMNRRALFLLAWKGSEIQVHRVEGEWGSRPAQAVVVRDGFLELLGYLKRLGKLGESLDQREIILKWMSFRGFSDAEQKVLREAGVEPFFFKPDGEGT
jgi:hypothetical protein